LAIVKPDAGQIQIVISGFPGQMLILEESGDLRFSWQALATNTLTTSVWIYTNSLPSGPDQHFFRAVRP
jgi:hypothetical protein